MVPPEAADALPLKPLEFAVLIALSQADLHGYAIAKRIAEREAGAIRLAPGNLYAILDRMMDAGWIRESGNDDRRRTYRITARGRRIAAAETHRLAAVLETAHGLFGRPRHAG